MPQQQNIKADCQVGELFLYYRHYRVLNTNNIMKSISISFLLIAVFFLAGCETTSTNSSEGNTAATAVGNGNPTLVIEYDESDPRLRRGSYNTINNEQDRFYYLERNFEKVLNKGLANTNLDFQLFPAREGDGDSVLELTLLSFDSPSPIELEIRMWVILKRGDEKKDFGVIRSRIVPQRPMTSGSIERDLDEIYTDLGQKVLSLIADEV